MPMLEYAQATYDKLLEDIPDQLEKLDARIKSTPNQPTSGWLELEDLRLTLTRTKIMMTHLKELLDTADANLQLANTIIDHS